MSDTDTMKFSAASSTLNVMCISLCASEYLIAFVSNAAKFTSEGEINLSFTVDEGKEEVRFSVTDTGCGIPEDKCEKIFERFEKLDDFIQGTGLGLSVCQIISEHPDEPPERALHLAEEDSRRFLEGFFQIPGAQYWIWEEEGRYVSCLRLKPDRDGLLLEALETRPDCRRSIL